MLNGVACGMIYRPLTATTRKPDTGAPAGECRCASEEKRCTRAMSTISLSPAGTLMMNDRCDVKADVADSVSRSLHGLSDLLTSLAEVST